MYTTLVLLLHAAFAAQDLGPVNHGPAPDLCPLLRAFLRNDATPKETQDLEALISGREQVRGTNRLLQGSVYGTIYASFDLFTEDGIKDPANFQHFHEALMNLEFMMREAKKVFECIAKHAPDSENPAIQFFKLFVRIAGYAPSPDAQQTASGDGDDVAADAIRDNLIAKRDQWRVFAQTILGKLAEREQYQSEYNECDARYDELKNSGAKTVELTKKVQAMVDAGVAVRQRLAKLDKWSPEAVLNALVENMEVNTRAMFEEMVNKNDSAKKLLIWMVRDVMSIQGQKLDDLTRRSENLEKNMAKILIFIDQWPRGWPFTIFCIFLFITSIPLCLCPTYTCLQQVICCRRNFSRAAVNDTAVSSLQAYAFFVAAAAGEAIVCVLFHYVDAVWIIVAACGIGAWYFY